MVSVHWQFKGIQASKLGQLKRCLFLNIIISFWVSQIMIQVFRAKPCSREEPRKGRLLGGAFLAQLRASRGVGKSSPTAGLAHKSGRHSRRKSFPGPQLHHHGPAAHSISTLTSVLGRARKPSRAQLQRQSGVPQCSRAPDWTCGQVNRARGLRECPAESMSALWQKVDGEEVINLSQPPS